MGKIVKHIYKDIRIDRDLLYRYRSIDTYIYLWKEYRIFFSTAQEHGYACQETTMVLRLQQISPLGENLQLPVTSS